MESLTLEELRRAVHPGYSCLKLQSCGNGLRVQVKCPVNSHRPFWQSARRKMLYGCRLCLRLAREDNARQLAASMKGTQCGIFTLTGKFKRNPHLSRAYVYKGECPHGHARWRNRSQWLNVVASTHEQCMACSRKAYAFGSGRKKYRLSPNQLLQLQDLFECRCAVCGAKRTGRALDIDHCHDCRKCAGRGCPWCVRMIACSECNISVVRGIDRKIKLGLPVLDWEKRLIEQRPVMTSIVVILWKLIQPV